MCHRKQNEGQSPKIVSRILAEPSLIRSLLPSVEFKINHEELNTDAFIIINKYFTCGMEDMIIMKALV